MAFYLILDKAKIHKNRELLNSAEVKFYSFVSDMSFSLPGLDQLLTASDPEDKREAVRNMARNVLSQWEGIEVQHVKDGDTFEFGDTGRVLYRSEIIPESFDWIMLVIENDKDVRRLGEKIEQILSARQTDSLAATIMELAAVAASPQTAAAIALSKMLIKGLTFHLKGNENDQLGLIEQSFVRQLHYPSGRRFGTRIQDLTGNMWYDYTIFALEDH